MEVTVLFYKLYQFTVDLAANLYLPQLDTQHVPKFKTTKLITPKNNYCSDILFYNYVFFDFTKKSREPL